MYNFYHFAFIATIGVSNALILGCDYTTPLLADRFVLRQSVWQISVFLYFLISSNKRFVFL